MAVLNATDLIIKIHSTDGSEEKIGFATSASLDISMDERDVTTKDSAGWKEIGGGQKSWTLSTDALYSATPLGASEGAGFDDLFTYLQDRTEVFVEFTTGTATTGDKYYDGKAYITSLSSSGGVEESATMSISLTGTGALSAQTQS